MPTHPIRLPVGATNSPVGWSDVYRPFRFLAIVAATALLISGFVVGITAVGSGLFRHTATADAMPLPALGSPAALGGSTVYAADGKTVLAVLHASQERKPDRYPSQTAKVLITAVLDTEDHRFYEHGGFDIPSTIRALANDTSGAASRAAPRSPSSWSSRPT